MSADMSLNQRRSRTVFVLHVYVMSVWNKNKHKKCKYLIFNSARIFIQMHCIFSIKLSVKNVQMSRVLLHLQCNNQVGSALVTGTHL